MACRGGGVKALSAGPRTVAILRLPVKLALCALAACAVAPAAQAGEAPCWYENGVVVVGAELMGVAGDYILDTGTPATQLAETQAQQAGYEATQLTGEVRLAGLTLKDRTVAVADIDVRTGLLPTHIAGIIGSDLLKDLVLEVSFSPCRIGLWPAGKAPRLRAVKTLRLHWIAGRPAIPAKVSDGATEDDVLLSVATGADAPVRLNEAFASVPAAEPPQEVFPYGVLRPRLASVAFAGHVWRELPGGLLKSDAGVDGEVGAPLLVGLKVRFDFPAGRLLLAAPNEEGPGSRRGPDRKALRRR
jgi:hypothetical protein